MENSFQLIGNVVSKPELNTTKSGTEVTTLTVATNEKWKDQNGQLQEKVTYLDIVYWANNAKYASTYLNKGDLVFVKGKIDREQKEEVINGETKKRYLFKLTGLSIQVLKKKDSSKVVSDDSSSVEY